MFSALSFACLILGDSFILGSSFLCLGIDLIWGGLLIKVMGRFLKGNLMVNLWELENFLGVEDLILESELMCMPEWLGALWLLLLP